MIGLAVVTKVIKVTKAAATTVAMAATVATVAVEATPAARGFFPLVRECTIQLPRLAHLRHLRPTRSRKGPSFTQVVVIVMVWGTLVAVLRVALTLMAWA